MRYYLRGGWAPSGCRNLGIDTSLLRVFVSSTSEDLKVHRAVARQVIANMRWHAVMMEDFGASATATVAACQAELAKCQLVLLIVAQVSGVLFIDAVLALVLGLAIWMLAAAVLWLGYRAFHREQLLVSR